MVGLKLQVWIMMGRSVLLWNSRPFLWFSSLLFPNLNLFINWIFKISFSMMIYMRLYTCISSSIFVIPFISIMFVAWENLFMVWSKRFVLGNSDLLITGFQHRASNHSPFIYRCDFDMTYMFLCALLSCYFMGIAMTRHVSDMFLMVKHTFYWHHCMRRHARPLTIFLLL